MAANRRYRSSFTDQVVDELGTAIRTRKYAPGHQLPSVEKLAADMGVGRSTIREALRVLQATGLVEVIHGRGTFVNEQRVTRSSGNLYSFSEIIRERGMKPGSRILLQEITAAGEEVAARLQIAASDKVNILKRLRFADGVPISLETAFSPQARFPDLFQQEWTPETSLYALLWERYGVIPQTAVQIVRAVTAESEESQLLTIESKSPMLMVETVTCDQHGLPIEFGRFRYRADRYEYRVHLRREPG